MTTLRDHMIEDKCCKQSYHADFKFKIGQEAYTFDREITEEYRIGTSSRHFCKISKVKITGKEEICTHPDRKIIIYLPFYHVDFSYRTQTLFEYDLYESYYELYRVIARLMLDWQDRTF